MLDKHDFNVGEKVTGKILIKSNVPEIYSVNIGLSCYMMQRNYSQNKNSRSRRCLFNFEKPLQSGGSLSQGQEIPFELTIPEDVMAKIENKVAQAAMGVISAIAGFRRRYDWYVEAKIDKKGLDIKNWQKIMVH